MRVKFVPSALSLRCLAFALLGMAFVHAAPEAEQPIRLRSGIIVPGGPGAAQAAQLPAALPGSGLYLVQFSGVLQETWREELAGRGIRLLRYVPENAFIARIPGDQVSQVQALPQVTWLGSYAPAFKLHPGLRGMEGGRIRLMTSADATVKDLAVLRRGFTRLVHQAGSRFGTILEGDVTGRQLAGLVGSDRVLWIEPGPRPRLFDEISTKIVAGDDGTNGTPAVVHGLGFDGSGVSVAVADSGLHNGDAATMHPDLAGRVDAFFFYGDLLDAADEHSHGTHVTGIVAGNGAVGETDENGFVYGLGVAPGAHIVAQRLFDGAGGYEPPPTFEAMTRDAVRAGAEIGSNSWGDDTQGRYDLSAAEFDALVRDADAGSPGDQAYILEFSAGNAGPGAQTVGSPAVAKNVIATGASQSDRFDFFIYAEGRETMADFSSRGPCEDGRIKPDIVAPGTWIASLKSASATDENAWASISENYIYQGGTSQAGPHASGAAAVFVQYYRETHGGATPSPALVKAALINSAVDLDDSFGTDPVPNMDEGWGRVDLTQLIGSSRRAVYLDQTVSLQSGGVHESRVVVASADEPLKVILAYTDVPGLPAAIPALVNDLDLEVVAPDGRIYRGNQMHEGESEPDPAGRDGINNVEGVIVWEPMPGEYVVRVAARRVVEDARADTPAIDQDFAVVSTAEIPEPGVGIVFFDRTAYSGSGVIRLKLIDQDLAGQPTAEVRLRSTTEAGGERVTLVASGSGGSFTNGVLAATGAAVVDGKLQVAHGDLVEAVYQDAVPAASRVATASADFLAPVISGISVTNRFGRTVISWFTDEPATAAVRYGTNSALAASVSSSLLETGHAVVLPLLEEGSRYFFTVSSADAAGNRSTQDNGGALFSFVVQPPKTVLLVNAYVHKPEYESVEIPVTSYTDALDQTGVSYEVWETAANGSPTAVDLKPYRAVMWRINDSIWDDRSLTPGEQAAIQAYLEGGGGFFMASMEILSRLGPVPFRTNVLQVQEFVTNPDPFGECPDCDEDHRVPTVVGDPGDPVSGGMDMALDYSAYPEIDLIVAVLGPDFSDTFKPTGTSTPVLWEPESGRAAGVRFPRTGVDSPGRVVFFSFPLDGVPESGVVPNSRANLLRNVLSFLAPGVGGLGTVSLDRGAYTVPSVVTVEVGDSDLAGSGQATVMFRTTSTALGQEVTLVETARKGLFRGTLTLVPTNAPPAAGELAAKNGDVLRVEYLDASSGGLVQVEVDIDTIAPEISGIGAVPDYESAEVTWVTTEPADALVQFGESPFLERTAFTPDLVYGQSAVLAGLRPDRVYYYRVVSRDEAGNTVVDDNGGQLYTLRTLKPIVPPWVDHLDTGATNWTVFDGDESQGSWRLGVPANGQETAAHSVPNAWGSNLDGGPLDFAQTFLISPAIDLTGGNAATLRFWHSYDFTDRSPQDILQDGQVLIVTNNVSQPALLAAYDDLSFGWEEAEIDLTPYTGRVVFLVWYYEMVSFDFEGGFGRPGWLIDDVSVSVATETRGTVVITNNLAQARYALAGPVSQTGAGLGTTVTNLPLGEYVVTYLPVAYYQTPAPRTNQVTSAVPVRFDGVYTFLDANANGMSDAWETQYFGSVSPDRTAATDTDGDGATDQAEFLAGTDPSSASSLLEVESPQVQPDGSLRFLWSSVPGRAYRVESSLDLAHWDGVTDWVVATATSSSVVLPKPAGAGVFYRVQVRP